MKYVHAGMVNVRYPYKAYLLDKDLGWELDNEICADYAAKIQRIGSVLTIDEDVEFWDINHAIVFDSVLEAETILSETKMRLNDGSNICFGYDEMFILKEEVASIDVGSVGDVTRKGSAVFIETPIASRLEQIIILYPNLVDAVDAVQEIMKTKMMIIKNILKTAIKTSKVSLTGAGGTAIITPNFEIYFISDTNSITFLGHVLLSEDLILSDDSIKISNTHTLSFNSNTEAKSFYLNIIGILSKN